MMHDIDNLIKKTRLASEFCPRVGLRSIQHNRKSSNDTHHFRAQVDLDDVTIMRVENEGRGGDNYYHMRRATTPEQIQTLTELARSFCEEAKPETYSEIVRKQVLVTAIYDDFPFVDVLLGSLLNEQLTLIDMRKALNQRIHIIDMDKPLLYDIDKRPTEIHLANSSKALKGIGKHFNYILLNELDEPSQLKLWLTIN
tara:strand:- start:1633 stop:2226 length:594 start_codon:yes stop_codon:yes gene_type:complete